MKKSNNYLGFPLWVLALFFVFLPRWSSGNVSLQEKSPFLTAQGFSVDGVLDITVKAAASDHGKTKKLQFEVDVSGSRYRIKIWSDGNPANYHEYVFDGTAMHILHHLTNSISKPIPQKNNRPLKTETVTFPATIEDREIPPTDGSRAQFVWLAFASHRFFSVLTNNLMSPIWSPEDPKLRRQPFEMLSFFEQFSSSRLPSVVSFVNDGFYRSYNPGTKALDVIPLSAPYKQGFTNAFYQVIEATNIAFGEIPSRFVFIAYSTPVGAGSQPFERLIIRGAANTINNFARAPISMPQFSGLANVADYRISGTIEANDTNAEYKYVAYPITNSVWQLDPAALASLRKTAEKRLKSQLENQGRAARSSPDKRRFLVTLAFVANALFLALVCWYANQRIKQKI